MSPWVEVAFSLDDPADFGAFVEVCSRRGIQHAFTEGYYQNRVAEIQAEMTKGFDPQEAYALIVTEGQYEGARGLGDTIANITHATGLDRLAKAYTAITGLPCGCATRQEALNKLFPYGGS